ncbi:putative C4orf29-like protein, partial [Naja naja]
MGTENLRISFILPEL